MKKCGLVLEGGGMRGLYTAGVLDFFLDQNLYFQDITTVSAGGCNAVSYVAKQNGRNLLINTKYCSDKRYISFSGLLTHRSIFGIDFMFHEIPEKLEPFDFHEFKNSNSTLTVAVTNVKTAKAEYFDLKDLKTDIDYLIASSSLPVFSPIVPIGDQLYLDGGVVDSIPVKKSLEKGNDVLVIVLTQHNGYQKKPSEGRLVYQRVFRKFPKFVEAIQNRHLQYNQTLELIKQLEAEGKAVVLRPTHPVGFGRFENNQEKLKSLYQDGYRDAKDHCEEILRLCKGASNLN